MGWKTHEDEISKEKGQRFVVPGINRVFPETNELKNLKVDITVLTETKKKCKGSDSCGNYDHFYSGVPRECRAKQEISIVVHRKWRKCITTWEPINKRMIRMNLKILGLIFGATK